MQTVTPTDTQASRPTERQTGGRRDGWVVGRAATHADREIARQTDRSTGTETDRQTASLTDALSRAVHVPVSFLLVLLSTRGQALAETRKKAKADIYEINRKAGMYEPGALSSRSSRHSDRLPTSPIARFRMMPRTSCRAFSSANREVALSSVTPRGGPLDLPNARKHH